MRGKFKAVQEKSIAFLNKKFNVSLKRKLNYFVYIIMIPFIVLTIFLIITLSNFSKKYDYIVANVTTASEFNFDFKEAVDSKMYQIVIGAKDFNEVHPYEDIKAAKKVVN
ncbi:MAG: hypothetical protein PHX08_22195, partial [Lachnospiraceae bacterium]|nr:hypothetical protein [Lachnospiraceae bacterium]